MSLKALIENQLAALNDPLNFEKLKGSLKLVEELMGNPYGDVLDTRTAMKKEVLRLEKALNKREGVEMLAYRLMTLSCSFLALARERDQTWAFSILSRPPVVSSNPMLPVVLARVSEHRLRTAFRRIRERAEVQQFAKDCRKKESSHNQKLAAVVRLADWEVSARLRRYRLVLDRLDILKRRTKALLKFARFFTIRKVFWTVAMESATKQIKDVDIDRMKRVLQKLRTDRLQTVFSRLRSDEPETDVLLAATTHVVKQSAFSAGPFATINAKVINSKSLRKWGVIQLVGAVNSGRVRQLEKSFVSMKFSFTGWRRVAVALERRTWRFRQYLRNSLQLRMNLWWRNIKEQSMHETIAQYKRKVYLRRVLKDKRVQTFFRRWKSQCKPRLAFGEKTAEIGLYKLVRIRMRWLRDAWRKIQAHIAWVKRQSVVGSQALAVALQRIVLRRQTIAFQHVYDKYRYRSKFLLGGTKLCRLFANNRKILKVRSLAKLKLTAQHGSAEYRSNYHSKVQGAIELFNFLANLRVKRLYNCWSALALRLNFTTEEVRLRLVFQRLKNKTLFERHSATDLLKAAIRRLKNNHRTELQRAFIRWLLRAQLRTEKAKKATVFYPGVAGKIAQWGIACERYAWDVLAALGARHMKVKQTLATLPQIFDRIKARRVLDALEFNRQLTKEQSDKLTAARKIVLIAQQRQESQAVRCLSSAAKIAKQMSRSKARSLHKLSKWASARCHPLFAVFYGNLRIFDRRYPIRCVISAVESLLRKQEVDAWARLQIESEKNWTKRDLLKRLSVLSLLHCDKKLAARCTTRFFRFWKSAASITKHRHRAAKLLSLTLQTRIKILQQQGIGAMRRSRYHKIVLRDKGKKAQRLIMLSSREEGFYSKMDALSKIFSIGIGRSLNFALSALFEHQYSQTERSRRSTLQQKFILRLTTKKGKNSLQQAFCRWRIATMGHLTAVSNQFLSRRLAFATLDTYRRKVLLVGCWSTMRRLAVELFWKRKRAVQVIIDALTTLKVAYEQAAFVALAITLYRYKPTRLLSMSKEDRRRFVSAVSLRLNSVDSAGVAIRRQNAAPSNVERMSSESAGRAQKNIHISNRATPDPSE